MPSCYFFKIVNRNAWGFFLKNLLRPVKKNNVSKFIKNKINAFKECL